MFSLVTSRHNFLLYTHQCSLDTVDFRERDPMLRITTLWFSESISSLSETDDVVHNVFHNTNAWGIVTSFISHRTKHVPSTLSFSKWSLQILLLGINVSFLCILNDSNLRPRSGVIVRIKKIITIVDFKMCFSFVNKRRTVDFKVFPWRGKGI